MRSMIGWNTSESSGRLYAPIELQLFASTANDQSIFFFLYPIRLVVYLLLLTFSTRLFTIKWNKSKRGGSGATLPWIQSFDFWHSFLLVNYLGRETNVNKAILTPSSWQSLMDISSQTISGSLQFLIVQDSIQIDVQVLLRMIRVVCHQSANILNLTSFLYMLKLIILSRLCAYNKIRRVYSDRSSHQWSGCYVSFEMNFSRHGYKVNI